MVGAGWPGTGGRLHRPRPPPPNGPTGPASSPGAAAVATAPIAEATSGAGRPWPTVAAGPTRSGCWAPNPDGTPPGRRRDWQVARAALEDLAGWSHHRDHRDQRQPNLERLGRTVGRDLGHQERDGR
jgi:hypothetical protein